MKILLRRSLVEIKKDICDTPFIHFFCQKNDCANKCKFCARAKHTLNQKMVRIKKGEEVTKKYMKLTNLSPQRRHKILRLQNKLKSEARGKIRAQNKVNVLKNVVKSCRQNIAKIETKNLHKILDNQKRLSRNEKIAITEIFAAASKKNPVSRKYSDDWVVLCMLIHMRSPAAYRMLRDNKILPLPSTRSIRS